MLWFFVALALVLGCTALVASGLLIITSLAFVLPFALWLHLKTFWASLTLMPMIITCFLASLLVRAHPSSPNALDGSETMQQSRLACESIAHTKNLGGGDSLITGYAHHSNDLH